MVIKYNSSLTVNIEKFVEYTYKILFSLETAVRGNFTSENFMLLYNIMGIQ
jgi:hypothetical protein